MLKQSPINLGLPIAPADFPTHKRLFDEFFRIYNALAILKTQLERSSAIIQLPVATSIPALAFVAVNAEGKLFPAANTSILGRAQAFVPRAASSIDIFATAAFAVFMSPDFGLLIPGEQYYLADSLGGITLTPPVASGTIVQEVGVALSSSDLLIRIFPPVVNP